MSEQSVAGIPLVPRCPIASLAPGDEAHLFGEEPLALSRLGDFPYLPRPGSLIGAVVQGLNTRSAP